MQINVEDARKVIEMCKEEEKKTLDFLKTWTEPVHDRLELWKMRKPRKKVNFVGHSISFQHRLWNIETKVFYLCCILGYLKLFYDGEDHETYKGTTSLYNFSFS